MSFNPLNELKRRLEDNSTPLPKRLCLAKNVVLSYHFPTTTKETIVAAWLVTLAGANELNGKQLKDVLGWITAEDLTSELKSKLIQVISQFTQNNEIKIENIHHILKFIENEKITAQLTQHVDEYFSIIVKLLKHLRNEENLNIELSQRILNNIVKYYKESKKKLEFILKLLDGENIETIFSYLDTECRDTVICVCQNILFPMNKKSLFVNFLQTLIRKDNIDELIAEKGDSTQSVLKIMSTFFTYPKGRSEKNQKFLTDFIEVFVSCFKKESQLIFAFYIMVVNSLNMDQSYLNAAMKMPPIMFEENNEKIKRNIFLAMLETLLKNEVDIGVRLTDTFGEKISKVEIKKTFLSFLQAVMMGQLKLEGKVDKCTIQIIKTALKLDPIIIEQKMDQILPPIMTAKKNSSSINESYIEMLNCLLEILFKLSRGTLFINKILPHLKLCLEAGNTEQFELKQKINECENSGANCDKLKNKLITGSDIFPPECVEMYGKWTSELMFRQNRDLLLSLQKDLEECLMMLEEGFVSPSIIIIAEVLSAILCAFLRRNKMADHTVPKPIAEEFWADFQKFEDECLGKFGECILRLTYNPQLILSFLQLSLSVANLKLLNIKYSHTKLSQTISHTSQVFDLSFLLPCLDARQWTEVCEKVADDEAVLVLDNLLLAKTATLQLSTKTENYDQSTDTSATKAHLIKQIGTKPEILYLNGFPNICFANLEEKQYRNVAKNLVKMCFSNNESEILKNDVIQNNRSLVNAITIETAKNMAKCFVNTNDLTKSLTSMVDFAIFVKKMDVKDYFGRITLEVDQENAVTNCLDIFKSLPVPYLEESYQLVVILLLLVAKKCCQKKIRKSVDHILLNIYELTPKYPDMCKLFPIDQIFSFEDEILLNLLTLKIKTSNNMFVIKKILESATKKVKTDCDIIKNLVQILLSNQKTKKTNVSSIEHFSDPVFQIICLILPIISRERKAITTSAIRSILANLQEKLQKCLLKSFKAIDFSQNSSLLNETIGNTDDSMVVSESTLATLNAMAAYSLTLAKYCETTDTDELKNLDCLWSGLEFFVQNAMNSIQNPSTKAQHVDSSIRLLNVVLRYIKKLESHPIFENKDTFFKQIWKSIVDRLTVVFSDEKRVLLDEFAVTLKFLSELSSVECFGNHFVGDLMNLGVLKETQKPSDIAKDPSILTSHKVSRYLWTQMLKANLLGPKCVGLSKLLSKLCKDLRSWIRMHLEDFDKKRKFDDTDEVKVVKITDEVCLVLKIDLDVVSEAILAAKKITLDYKLLDSIFSLQSQAHLILGNTALRARCEVGGASFVQLFESCVGVLNSLLLSREQLLEDRWPNYMQCYRALTRALCQRAAPAPAPAPASAPAPAQRPQPARDGEHKLAELAHAIEKLTQSLTKRKGHTAHIAAYSACDVCALLERAPPPAPLRGHLDNCAAMLLQAADSSYDQAFLRRALANSPGHVTLSNMYTLYKRYHKYVGNS